MNQTLEAFERSLAEFAVRYGRLQVRESGYSHLLFAHLRETYGDVFMTGIGINRNELDPVVSSRCRGLIDAYLGKSVDLYPDLTAFRREVLSLELGAISRLERLPASAAPWLMCEWKFTSSFPNMQRGHIIKDAVKLEILADFLRHQNGETPSLLQVVFNFPGRKYFSLSRVAGWFGQESFLEATPNVRSIMVMHSGERHVLSDTSV